MCYIKHIVKRAQAHPCINLQGVRRSWLCLHYTPKGVNMYLTFLGVCVLGLTCYCFYLHARIKDLQKEVHAQDKANG